MRSALVVGAGVFGLAAARALAGRGWRVDVVDRHEPGTSGPSAADSRIIRSAHGPDWWWTRMAWLARTAWRELEAETDTSLMLTCGVALLATDRPDSSAWEEESLRTLREHGIPVERLGPDDLEKRFDGLGAAGVRFAVFEPEAGVLLARQATLALAGSARERGATIRLGEATAHPDGALIDGTCHRADAVVWAAGSGLVELFPRLSSSRRIDEACAYLRSARAATPDTAADTPALISRSEDFYAVPALDARGVKVGPFDQSLAAKIRLRLPELAGLSRKTEHEGANHGEAEHGATGRSETEHGEAVSWEDESWEIESCHYTAMPDVHFLLARHPDRPGQWLVGGDGGRGFKHGPAWGEYVADVIEGRREPLPRFALR
jgi:sarcosine oxidase